MFQRIVTAWRIDRGCSRMLEHAKPTWYNKQVHGCCNIAVQSCYFIIPLTTCSIMYEHGCWFVMMVPTTLFKSVRSSSHEQSVPTCMTKPVNNHVQAVQLNLVQAGQLNHVQADQLNHVQADQLNHVQACQQPCSSWPAHPCLNLSTGTRKLWLATKLQFCYKLFFAVAIVPEQVTNVRHCCRKDAFWKQLIL